MFFLYGALIIAFGFLIVAKSEWMLNNFGRIGWFDQHLGLEGGTRLGYKLIGMLVIFIGFLVITNMFGGFMEWLVSPLTKYNR
jgi:hypothetical protein